MANKAHRITDKMLRNNKNTRDIQVALEKRDTHPCVVRECLGEFHRREWFEKRRVERKAKEEAAK